MARRSLKTEKISSLLQCIESHLNEGKYIFTNHALQRRAERSISLPDILHVLRTGFHEKIKDQWDGDFNVWNYSIRGRAIDGDDLRVIVSIERNLQIITVIRIEGIRS